MNPSSDPQNPNAAPAQSAQQLLAGIPAYRKNGTCSALLFVALAAAFLGPMLLAGVLRSAGVIAAGLTSVALGAPLLFVCVIVLTGDVYLDTLDAQGQLKKWGIGNKVVAAAILLGWAYSIVRQFM